MRKSMIGLWVITVIAVLFSESFPIVTKAEEPSDLETLYNTWTSVSQGDYTDNSWKRLQSALTEAAPAVAGKTEITEDLLNDTAGWQTVGDWKSNTTHTADYWNTYYDISKLTETFGRSCIETVDSKKLFCDTVDYSGWFGSAAGGRPRFRYIFSNTSLNRTYNIENDLMTFQIGFFRYDVNTPNWSGLCTAPKIYIKFAELEHEILFSDYSDAFFNNTSFCNGSLELSDFYESLAEGSAERTAIDASNGNLTMEYLLFYDDTNWTNATCCLRLYLNEMTRTRQALSQTEAFKNLREAVDGLVENKDISKLKQLTALYKNVIGIPGLKEALIQAESVIAAEGNDSVAKINLMSDTSKWQSISNYATNNGIISDYWGTYFDAEGLFEVENITPVIFTEKKISMVRDASKGFYGNLMGKPRFRYKTGNLAVDFTCDSLDFDLYFGNVHRQWGDLSDKGYVSLKFAEMSTDIKLETLAGLEYTSGALFGTVDFNSYYNNLTDMNIKAVIDENGGKLTLQYIYCHSASDMWYDSNSLPYTTINTMCLNHCVTLCEAMTSLTKADKAADNMIVKGDINGDGISDIRDAVLSAITLSENGNFDPNNAFAADLDKNSEFNQNDYSLIKDTILKSQNDLSVVYVSENGNDNSDGSFLNPVKSLHRAAALVSDNGTVSVVDHLCDIDLKGNVQKTLSLQGGAISFNDCYGWVLSSPVSINNTVLETADHFRLIADGNSLTLGEGVSTVSNIIVYGGGNHNNVASSDITLLGGKCSMIYGGGYGADSTVSGDTNVVVGGYVNSEIDPSDHNYESKYFVFGGGSGGNVSGNTNINICGDAQTSVIYGGGSGVSSSVNGVCRVNMTGGNLMGIYGGSNNGNVRRTSVSVSSGTVEQIFGGSEDASVSGDTEVSVSGGTVKRRIYGGCYNNYEDSWLSNYHVSGTTTVVISGSPQIISGSFADRGIRGGSRYHDYFPDETNFVIFLNGTYNEKLVALDFAADWVGIKNLSNYTVCASSGGEVTLAGRLMSVVPQAGYISVCNDISYSGNTSVLLPQKTTENYITNVLFQPDIDQ